MIQTNIFSCWYVSKGFMWDKETEVDRFRERVPLANLVSQCKLYEIDPSKPKPRDWVGAFKRATEESDFVIIPELKRLEPKVSENTRNKIIDGSYYKQSAHFFVYI